jgi:hypothetical protein
MAIIIYSNIITNITNSGQSRLYANINTYSQYCKHHTFLFHAKKILKTRSQMENTSTTNLQPKPIQSFSVVKLSFQVSNLHIYILCNYCFYLIGFMQHLSNKKLMQPL